MFLLFELACFTSPQVGGTIDGRPSVAFPLVTKEKHIGLAVNKDCSRMAVGCTSTSRIYVYSLPTGVFVSEFQSTSDHKGPVSDTPPFKMCFMPNDNLLFAQKYAGRLVECTLTGDFVREFAPPVDDRRHRSSQFWSVAVNDSVVVAGVWGSGPQIYVFDVGTGALLRGFGQEGSEIGKLKSCIGLRITPDNSHVLIAEYFSNRVSLWTLDGQYVRSFTSGVSGPHDIEFASNGDIIVAEYGGKCVSVHSSDGSMMLRRFNNAGSKFKDAIALAMWGRRLLVLEGESDKLCSFE